MVDLRPGIILLGISVVLCAAQAPYYGKLIGRFQSPLHEVEGLVYVAKKDTIFIKGFSYDGLGPAAYFWVGDTEEPGPEGTALPFLQAKALRKSNNRDVIVQLPEGKTIDNYKYFGVWCQSASQDFGHVKIPSGFEAPQERVIGRLSSLAHGVHSGAVTIKDSKTIHIENLYYDGLGPDAFFLVGIGREPSVQGTKVPDENGSLQKAHGYKGESITLRLPGELSFMNLDWFSLYCFRFTQNFGDIFIPNDLNVPPGDLRRKKTHVRKHKRKKLRGRGSKKAMRKKKIIIFYL